MPLQGSNRHIKPTSFLSLSSFIHTLYIHMHVLYNIYTNKNKEMAGKMAIWMKLMEVGFEFIMEFFEAFKIAIHQTNPKNISFTPSTPYISLIL